ncbi:MAG: TonB family protein [Planctomycetes bacterium]|nr:TonB family protein [Planctomycetota bacterium]
MKWGHLAIALLLHAGAIGLACWQLEPPRLTESQAPAVVSAGVRHFEQQAEPERPFTPPQAAPAQPVEQPGELPAPTEILLPHEEPQPEPTPPAPTTATEDTLPEPARFTQPNTFRRPQPAGPTPASDAQPTAAESPVASGPVTAPETPPRILNPRWPELVRKGFTGRVVIDVVVRLDGRAHEVEVIEGTGRAEWDKALTNAFREASYLPGFLNGQPVICKHRYSITFRKR